MLRCFTDGPQYKMTTLSHFCPANTYLPLLSSQQCMTLTSISASSSSSHSFGSFPSISCVGYKDDIYVILTVDSNRCEGYMALGNSVVSSF